MIKFLNEGIAKKYTGKICILRIDLNIDAKSEEGLFRLRSVLPTIKLLRKHKMRIVLVSHKGRPDPKHIDKKLSLKPFAAIIEKEAREHVVFVPSLDFAKINDAVENAKENIILLENARFYAGEEKNDAKLGKQLASLGNFYVNDAFAVSHRAHASVVAITKFLPHFGGLQLEKEIKNLSAVMKKPEAPFLVILGGAKTADKLPVIERFLKTADMFLIAGGPGNTLLAAQGIPMGNSLYDAKLVNSMKKFAFKPNVFTPSDTVGIGTKILDIGPETAEEYAELIRTANTIIWNGPMGLFEKKKFSKGTKVVWDAVLESASRRKNAKIVVGGGETIASLCVAAASCSIPANIFLSTGGGAMLEFLSGKKLPGIEALK